MKYLISLLFIAGAFASEPQLGKIKVQEITASADYDKGMLLNIDGEAAKEMYKKMYYMNLDKEGQLTIKSNNKLRCIQTEKKTLIGNLTYNVSYECTAILDRDGNTQFLK